MFSDPYKRSSWWHFIYFMTYCELISKYKGARYRKKLADEYTLIIDPMAYYGTKVKMKTK